MVYYCANCWKEIKKDEKACPNCGAEQKLLDNETFIQKLIRALDHHEPVTPVRAANILGELNAKEAVPVLLCKLKNQTDPFLTEAIVKTILKLNPNGKSEIIKIIGSRMPITIKKLME